MISRNLTSQYQCGFRKRFSVSTTLLPMIENCKKSLGNFGALLTDLPKAFDCFPHNLLIAKLHACGLDMSCFKLLHSYLTKRRQRVKMNNTFNSCSKMESHKGLFLAHFYLIYFCVTCFF